MEATVERGFKEGGRSITGGDLGQQGGTRRRLNRVPLLACTLMWSIVPRRRPSLRCSKQRDDNNMPSLDARCAAVTVVRAQLDDELLLGSRRGSIKTIFHSFVQVVNRFSNGHI